MQKPLELILARNLLASISTPAFLVDEPGDMVFYNEAAERLLGVRFEEAGDLSAMAWTSRFGPFDAEDRPIPLEELSITRALRGGRPSHSRFHIHSTHGAEHDIEASAFPIVGADGFQGAIVIFWPVNADGSDAT